LCLSVFCHEKALTQKTKSIMKLQKKTVSNRIQHLNLKLIRRSFYQNLPPTAMVKSMRGEKKKKEKTQANHNTGVTVKS